jgi:predicted nucleic-acid-binding Zn-ribbon protein
MNFITVATFQSSIEAYILKNHLEGAGITCFIFDEHIVDMNPLYSNAVGGVKVKVRQNDSTLANELIQELNKTPYKDEKDHVVLCPNCGSSEFYTDFNSMRNPGSILAVLTSFLFAVFPIYKKRVNRCKKCDTEFDQKKIVEG